MSSWRRPLDVDFYVCPNTGDYVYRWADERMVLLSSDEVRRLRAAATATPHRTVGSGW